MRKFWGCIGWKHNKKVIYSVSVDFQVFLWICWQFKAIKSFFPCLMEKPRFSAENDRMRMANKVASGLSFLFS
jgi:hypothetical protein